MTTCDNSCRKGVIKLFETNKTMKLKINRRRKFDPSKHLVSPGGNSKEDEIGKSWTEFSIWRGAENCSGKVGWEDQDGRSLKIDTLDTASITRDNLVIPAHAKKWLGSKAYPRDVEIALGGRILADAQIGLALLKEKDQLTLNRLYEEFDCGLIHLLGTKIRVQNRFRKKPGITAVGHFMFDDKGDLLPHWVDHFRTNRTMYALYIRRYSTETKDKFRWGFGAWPMMAERTRTDRFFALSFPGA